MKKKIKVIFIKDVPGTAYKYDVKDVSLGYFRNYLAPQGLAKVATNEALADLEKKRAQIEEEKKKRIEEFKQKAAQLEGMVLEFKERAEEGKLFGSVSNYDVEKALQEKGFEGITVSMEPIKQVGEYEAEVNFGEGIKASIKVKVESLLSTSQ